MTCTIKLLTISHICYSPLYVVNSQFVSCELDMKIIVPIRKINWALKKKKKREQCSIVYTHQKKKISLYDGRFYEYREKRENIRFT